MEDAKHPKLKYIPTTLSKHDKQYLDAIKSVDISKFLITIPKNLFGINRNINESK